VDKFYWISQNRISDEDTILNNFPDDENGGGGGAFIVLPSHNFDIIFLVNFAVAVGVSFFAATEKMESFSLLLQKKIGGDSSQYLSCQSRKQYQCACVTEKKTLVM